MVRNPLIEAIHEARYDLETCAREQRATCQRKLDELLRRALERAGSHSPNNCWMLYLTITGNLDGEKNARGTLTA
jgi:hypothetical protein